MADVDRPRLLGREQAALLHAFDCGAHRTFLRRRREIEKLQRRVHRGALLGGRKRRRSLHADSFSLAVLFRDEYFVIGFVGCLIRITQSCLPDTLIKIFKRLEAFSINLYTC